MIDSTNIGLIIENAMEIGGAIVRKDTLIPNIPDEITTFLLTTVFGAVVRFFEKRRLKRKAKNEEAK